MENASKALLIAAGIIITLLIITLLVGLYNEVSSYYESKHNMTEAEQLEKFNSVYLNYNDTEIRGNELISVMNRIIDYNNLQARENGYERIIIKIDFNGHIAELAYDNNPTLFNGNLITNDTNDMEIKRVAELPITLVSSGLTDLKLQKLSSEIHNIVLDNPNDEEKSERAKKLTRILGRTINKDDNIDDIEEATLKYYQITQFKRTMFECTNVSVDTATGRVNKMEFIAVLENGQLKMD